MQGVASLNSIKIGTVYSLASHLVKDKESFKFFRAFLYLACLTKKTKAVVSTITNKMPIIIPAIALLNTFKLFEFLDREDIKFSYKLKLKPFTGQD